MPNVDEQGFDWDSMTQTETAPSGQPAGHEGLQLEEPPQRQRDEKGRFVSQSEEYPPSPTEPEQHDEGDPGQPGYSPEIQALLAKYGGNVEAALAASVEAQQYVGRSKQEMGELRRELEELRARQEQAFFEDDESEFAESFDEQLEADAAEAAMAAFQRGDNARFQQAYAQWTRDDPVTARIWGESQAAKLELAQVREQMQATMQPVVEDRRQQAEINVFTELAREYPDIAQNIDGINQVLQENQVLYFLAHEGIPEAKKQAIAMAHQVALARKSATQGTMTATQSRLAAQQEQMAAEQAFVTSGQNAVRGQEESLADIVTRGWDDISTSHHWGD
jgi:hypothetical protein